MKKNFNIFLLVIVTIAVVITSIIMNYNKKEEKEKNINIVTNYTNFYTIDSCANRFINSVATKDTDSLLKQLNNSYKKENKINKENVLNIIGTLDANNYKSNKMYYETINENIYKYYVQGTLIKEVLGDDMDIVSTKTKDYYLIIYLNVNNNTFSVEPYDGKLFIEGDTNE